MAGTHSSSRKTVEKATTQAAQSNALQKSVTAETTFSGVLGLSVFQVRAGIPAQDAISEASNILSAAITIITNSADEGDNALHGVMVQINAAKALIDSIERAVEGGAA